MRVTIDRKLTWGIVQWQAFPNISLEVIPSHPEWHNAKLVYYHFQSMKTLKGFSYWRLLPTISKLYLTVTICTYNFCFAYMFASIMFINRCLPLLCFWVMPSLIFFSIMKWKWLLQTFQSSIWGYFDSVLCLAAASFGHMVVHAIAIQLIVRWQIIRLWNDLQQRVQQLLHTAINLTD